MSSNTTASKERQLIRWSNIKSYEPKMLKCYICDYNSDISNYSKYTASDIFNAGTLIRYKCPNCLTIFGDLRFLNLPLDEIQKDYEDVYSYYKEGDTTKYILEVLNSLDICKDKTKKYLDFACGKWNSIIPHLRNNGYNIIGYDKYISSNEYIVNTIDDKFDIIYNCNYIEHFINPMSNMSEIVSLLNDNGYIIFITQCFEYCIEFTHYHTFFFSDKALNIIAAKLNLLFIYSNKINFADGEWTIVKVFKRNI